MAELFWFNHFKSGQINGYLCMPHPVVALLRTIHPIALADEELIANAFEAKAFKEGDILFSGGKVCNELFFITEGVLRILMINEKAVEVTHVFLKENQFCTILRSFTEGRYASELIQASSDGSLWTISKAKLEALYLQIPFLKQTVDSLMQKQLLDKINFINAYLGLDSMEKYELFLQQQASIAHRIPLKDIASYLGITPQSLSRIRKNSIQRNPSTKNRQQENK